MPKEVELKKMKKSFKVRGNFRDIVFTTNEFFNSKVAIENLVKDYKNIYSNLTLINSSDGAYIHGFIPLKFSNILNISTKEKPPVNELFEFINFKKLKFRKDVIEDTKKMF